MELLRARDEITALEAARDEVHATALAAQDEAAQAADELRSLQARHQAVGVKVKELLSLEEAHGASGREAALRTRITELKEEHVAIEAEARRAAAEAAAELESVVRRAALRAPTCCVVM